MRAETTLVVFACAALASGCDVIFRIDYLPPSDADRSDAADAKGMFGDAPEACPSTYVTVADAPASSRYRWVTASLTWDLAEIDCENDSATDITHLVVFDDPLEMGAMRRSLNLESSGSFLSLVGYGRDTGSNPLEFYAVTGQAVPATVPPWAPNEPDNGGPGGTEETIVWFSTNEDLVDGPITFAAMYTCECDHQRVTKHFIPK